MFKLLLALHLLFAIFAIGPLVHAATTASRGVRRSDAAAIAASVRVLRIYTYASVLVVILGGALMSVKRNGQPVGDISDLWIWLSLLLWAASIALIMAVAVPTLNRVALAAGEGGRGAPVATLTGRVAAVGGVVGVLFAVIVFLMVYRPGS